MNGQGAWRAVKETLEKAGVEDAGFEAEQLLRFATGRGRFDLDDLEAEDWEYIGELAGRRIRHEPLQYILGSWPFLGIEMRVGPGVLIPRPETEEVCLAAATLLAKGHMDADRSEEVTVLDLCAGSGALALGLQSFLPHAAIWAVEADKAAYHWLLENLEGYREGETYDRQPADEEAPWRVPAPVLADVAEYFKTLGDNSVDLIVSNPPYVTEAEYETLAPEVKREPRRALVASEDGLAFYRQIARDYFRVLKPGAALVFETGAAQGPAVEALLAAAGYTEVELRRDMAGHQRIALARKPI